jgi:hypothetical protein
MPALIWLSLTALLYDRTAATCVAMREALHTVSHDRLTRMLQADWAGHTLLERAGRLLLGWERGYLSLEDPVIPKPLATARESRAWVFSSQERRFTGHPRRLYRRHPSWTACGWLTGGLKVVVVSDGAKYEATNRLRLAAAEGRRLYPLRAQIEEVIRAGKDQLGLSGCPA